MSDLTLTPVKYRADGIPFMRREHGPFIESREQRDGSILWAVTYFGDVLNRGGEWEWEPLPSSRDDDFIARTRFCSIEDAAAALSAAYGGQSRTPGDPA